MSAEKKKIRCRTYARKQRIQEKYRTLIITNKTAVVKPKRRTNYEVIKSFGITELAFFLLNFRKSGLRNIRQIEKFLSREERR